MNNRRFRVVGALAVLVLVGTIGAPAQTPEHLHFRGFINDYTPANVGGPWQVSGHWSLRVRGESGKADFSAALTMVRSDLGVADLNSPAERNAHTHHITLLHGTVTSLPNGFRVTGAATITANGNYPPPFGGSSTLQIDVIGGNSVAFSNIKVTFMGDAMAHFGPQPVNGVVRSVK